MEVRFETLSESNHHCPDSQHGAARLQSTGKPNSNK